MFANFVHYTLVHVIIIKVLFIYRPSGLLQSMRSFNIRTYKYTVDKITTAKNYKTGLN